MSVVYELSEISGMSMSGVLQDTPAAADTKYQLQNTSQSAVLGYTTPDANSRISERQNSLQVTESNEKVRQDFWLTIP